MGSCIEYAGVIGEGDESMLEVEDLDEVDDSRIRGGVLDPVEEKDEER